MSGTANMAKPLRILVFGKPGCDKCKVLNQRLDNLLDKPEWQDFEKRYCDLSTEEGLVQFAEAECVNPQQIPAFLVTRRDPSGGTYAPVPNRRPGVVEEVYGKSKLYQFLGLRTDYSETGRGLISPQMITAVLDEARSG
jgi:hypothetical protein